MTSLTFNVPSGFDLYGVEWASPRVGTACIIWAPMVETIHRPDACLQSPLKQNIDSLTKKLQVGSASNSCPFFLIVLGATGCNALTNHASRRAPWWKHAPSWQRPKASHEPLRSQRFAPSCMTVPFADHQTSVGYLATHPTVDNPFETGVLTHSHMWL